MFRWRHGLSRPELWDVLKVRDPVVKARDRNWRDGEAEYLWETSEKLLSPGDARGAVSGDLRTELYMCGYLEDYYDESNTDEKIGFFTLRTSKAAHPDLRERAIQLKELMNQRYQC
jgi:hypothetical protein